MDEFYAPMLPKWLEKLPPWRDHHSIKTNLTSWFLSGAFSLPIQPQAPALHNFFTVAHAPWLLFETPYANLCDMSSSCPRWGACDFMWSTENPQDIWIREEKAVFGQDSESHERTCPTWVKDGSQRVVAGFFDPAVDRFIDIKRVAFSARKQKRKWSEDSKDKHHGKVSKTTHRLVLP